MEWAKGAARLIRGPVISGQRCSGCPRWRPWSLPLISHVDATVVDWLMPRLPSGWRLVVQPRRTDIGIVFNLSKRSRSPPPTDDCLGYVGVSGDATAVPRMYDVSAVICH